MKGVKVNVNKVLSKHNGKYKDGNGKEKCLKTTNKIAPGPVHHFTQHSQHQGSAHALRYHSVVQAADKFQITQGLYFSFTLNCVHLKRIKILITTTKRYSCLPFPFKWPDSFIHTYPLELHPSCSLEASLGQFSCKEQYSWLHVVFLLSDELLCFFLLSHSLLCPPPFPPLIPPQQEEGALSQFSWNLYYS